jgi:anti-sigma-K factor RskA
MHPNETVIHDYIDDALDARERGAVERHLESCAACRQLVDDLREIRTVASSLEPRDPPVRAWARLERAIKLENGPYAMAGGVAARKTKTIPFVWLAVAATLLLATFVGLRFTPDAGRAAAPAVSSAPPPDSVASSTDSAQSVETELRQAEDHYEKAIKGLEQIATAEAGVFDPRTAATLQKNLAVIDQAIGESRAALRSEPASEPAQQSLMENFKAKIGLLQDTVALINEMRKGNDAGAARVVSGLKQRGD